MIEKLIQHLESINTSKNLFEKEEKIEQLDIELKKLDYNSFLDFITSLDESQIRIFNAELRVKNVRN